MKKFLTSILTLLLALCCFAGCGLDIQFGPAGQTSSVSYDVEAAAENLISNVRTSNGSTREDYEVPKQFFFDDATYTVTWSVSCEVEGTVAIVVGGEGALTDKVDVYENAATDIPYVLTATVKAGDDTTATRSLNRTVLAAPSIVPQAIDKAPVAGEAYKLHMYQSIKKADEYMTGEMNGFYYATTLDYTKSPDITVTPVEGKDNAFYLSFIKANVKYYIGVSNGWNATKDYWTNNAIFNTSLTAVEEGYYFTYEWNWNTDHQTMTATYNARTCTEKQFGDLETPNAAALEVEAKPVTLFLGTTGSYYTFDALNVENIKGAHVGKLVKMVDKSTVPSEDKVEAAKLALNVATTYNGATTVELPTMDKTYPEVSITWAVKEGTEAANITLNGNVLTIANPSETVTTTLIASFTCGEGEEVATDSAEIVITSKKEILSTLTEGTAYKMYVDQNTLGKTIYATTSISSGRITTTTSAKAAADIYAEIVEGGYKFYTLDGTTKNYMSLYSEEYTKNDGSTGYYNNIKFAADVSSVFTYNEEKNCWCGFIGTNEFYLGTYASYDTISISFSSYITATNTGVSQFPANFVLSATAEAEDTTPEVTLPEAGSDITIAQANEYGLSGVTGANKYYVTGTITSITNTSYGNMYIEDSNGDSILIWGLYADANKETKYEAMTDKPVVGDIIKVYAALSKHNNAAQLPDAQLITLTKTDAGNVTKAFAALTAPESKVEATGDVTLPALDGVAVVWSVATNDYATVANNVLTVSTMPAETTELTLTATITIGSATDSKDFKVALFVAVSGRTEIAFEFGENGTGSSTSIDNGSDIGTAKDYSSNGYTLSLTEVSKVYEGAYDATGKSCLKLGTSSVVATFTFVVPDDVHTVIIKAAKYKTYNDCNKLSVNGTVYTLTTNSSDGVYTAIEIDTTQNKTVTVATVTDAERACIDSITFVVGFDAEEPGDSSSSDVVEPGDSSTSDVVEPGDSSTSSDSSDSSDSSSSEEITAPEADTVITYAQATALAAAQEHDTYTTEKYYLIGTVKSISNTQYGNIYIEDEEGNEFYVYGLYSDNTRYDAMQAKPLVGDTIKVYGSLGRYYSTNQMKNAQLAEHTATDANKVTTEKNLLDLATKSAEVVGNVTLNTAATVYDNVTIAWTNLDDTTYADLANNVLTIKSLPSKDATVTLTATISLGEVSETKTFPFTIKGQIVVTYVSGTVNTADFNTFKITGNQGSTSYGSCTTTNGWVLSAGRFDSGINITSGVATANLGKVSGNTLTSPTLSNGLSKLTFNYGYPFSDTSAKFTVEVKQNSTTVAKYTINHSITKNEKATYTFDTSNLISGITANTALTTVTGDYTIVLTTQSTTRPSIWNLKYTDMNAAANLKKAVAVEDAYVQLTSDVTLTETLNIAAGVTLDLAGHTLSASADMYSALSVIGDGVTITGNGTIANAGGCGILVGDKVSATGGLTIENVTLTALEGCVVVYGQSNLTITDGTFTSTDNAVIMTNGLEGLGGYNITINGGTFNANITTAGYVAMGIYQANDGTLTVNGGTFNVTNGVGIVCRDGSTTIAADVVINLTQGDVTEGKAGDSTVVLTADSYIVKDFAFAYGTPVLTNNTSYDVVEMN